MNINKRLQFFAKIFQRSTDLQTYVAKASGHVHEKPIGDADTTHKQRMDTPVYTTDRYATDINYAVSQFPDKSAAIVNNDVTARAKKVSQGHFTGASHYLVEEVMIENAAARGYTLMVTGWTGKGTLTKTVNGVVNEGPYAPDTEVVLAFTPAAGYQFVRWSDGVTTASRTVTMDSNKIFEVVAEEAPAVDYFKVTLTTLAEGDAPFTYIFKEGELGTWDIEYSTDGTTWNEYTFQNGSGEEIQLLSVGDYVLFRGTKSTDWECTKEAFMNVNFNCPPSCENSKFAISGDITTLLNPAGNVLDLTPYGKFVFYKFAHGADLVVDASALVLPSTTITAGCYASMFNSCSRLTFAPVLLPAMTLPACSDDVGCYMEMFSGCTALTSAPSLPATTLASYCYDSMFYGCTSLTSAPSLLAETLAEACYEYMFQNCSALTSAPVLPAPTLVTDCYNCMFDYCTSLVEVHCYATDISASGCTSYWLDDGVPDSGDFYGKTAANWSTGVSGIPTGWTRHLD